MTPSYLTLDEAAAFLSKELNIGIDPRGVLALGERDRLPIYAPIKEDLTFEPYEELVSAGITSRRAYFRRKGDLLILSKRNLSDLLAKGETGLRTLVVEYSERITNENVRYRREIGSTGFFVTVTLVDECRLLLGEVERYVRGEKLYSKLCEQESGPLTESESVIAVSDTTPEAEQLWRVAEIERSDPLRSAIHRYLLAEHEKGRPHPPTHGEMLNYWEFNRPREICQITANGLSYYDKAWEEKEVTKDSIRRRMNALIIRVN